MTGIHDRLGPKVTGIRDRLGPKVRDHHKGTAHPQSLDHFQTIPNPQPQNKVEACRAAARDRQRDTQKRKASPTPTRGRPEEPGASRQISDKVAACRAAAKVAACRAAAKERQQSRDSHSSTRVPPKRRRGGDYNGWSERPRGIYVDFGTGPIQLANPYHNMVGFGIRKGLEDNDKNGPRSE